MNPQRRVHLVVVTGGGSARSRSKILGEAIAARVQSHLATDRADVEIGALVPEFGAAQQRRDVPARVEQALRRIEQAEAVAAEAVGLPGLLRRSESAP